ncbi:hypothetical protein PybrP1_007710 [[Pythium] brassicae (nom. inval.)]|nr:hypothetical protein PybrP1_007710 [[Pythium] brassicae (nom. inval.)]
MKQQEWRRRAARRSASDERQSASDTLPTGATHTVSSASKVVRKSAAALPTPAPPPIRSPPSRWKELRQAVRIKATMETEQRRPANARIADLCDEDREKVAKLIRRIVEEETENEFGRQRGVLEAEIRELREQVKCDTGELDELSDALKAALLKLRGYQERVLVLEESNEAEARRRHDTDQTVDLLTVRAPSQPTLCVPPRTSIS